MNKTLRRIVAAVIAVAVTLTAVFVFDVPEMMARAADTGECEHRSIAYDSIKEATCTERGTNGRACHCIDCGKYYDKSPFLYPDTAKELTYEEVYDIPPLGHDFSYLGKDDTYHWYKCSRCDEKREKIAHSGGTATCKAKAACEVCGREYGEKGDHIYNTEWSTSDSYHWLTCSLCGNKKDHALHSGGTATCTKKKVCDICGLEYGYLSAHNYSTEYEYNDTQHWKVCINPGCDATNTPVDHNFVWKKDETGHWHECSVCGYKKDDKESHNIVLWEGRAPTCKLIGFTDGLRCSECYYVEKARERLDKTDHTWGDWVVTIPATEETEGERTHTCSVCDTVETETIPVTGHTFSEDWTSDDTYHWHASTCAHPDVVDGKAPHTWSDWAVKTPATETSKGEETRECSVCHTAESREIPVLDHVHSLTKHNSVEPDCTTAGNVEYWSCAGCGKNFSDENGTAEVTDTVLPAKGHTEVTDAAVAATCTDTGLTEGKHCSVCNTVITAQTTIPANGHTWGAWAVKTPATETSKGEETRECSVCHTTESRDIPALNHKHTLVHIPETPATETTEGEKEHWHCDGCGKDFFDEEGKQEADREELKIGKIETEVQAPPSVPKPEIAIPKEELIEATLSADEKKMVDEGAFIKIILKVEDATNSVPAADKTAVTGKLGELTDHKLGQYLDVTMLKKIGELEQAITNTHAPIKITFEIPSAFRGKSEYSVIRVHGGETTILRDLDSDPNTVTIETDKFSTYALTYKEKTSGGGSGSSGGGGSSHRHRYIYDETIIKEPTCTESGEKTLSCSCGDTITETVLALGHDYRSEITKPATETEDGVKTFTCTRCGDTYTEIIPKTGSESKPSDTSSDTSDNTSSGTSDDTSSGVSTSDDASSDSGDISSDNSGSSSGDSGTSSISGSSSGGTGEDNPITGVAAAVPLMAVIAVTAALAVTKSRKK